MAKFRYVMTEFWEDPRVIEEMTPEDKLFYLYLLTNPKTTQIGIYQITKKQMAFELGYSIESINALMDRFENHHRLLKYNSGTREICILNWAKYNLDNDSKPKLNCIESELKNVKDKSFILHMTSKIPKETVRKLFLDAYEGLSTETTTRTTARGEPEPELEPELELELEQQPQQENNLVVVDKIKEYFLLDYKDIKKVADTFIATSKEISYLEEKLKLTKNNPNTRDVVGYLISALKNDYKNSINDYKCFIPQVKTRFHNINQTFTNYTPDELEKLLLESQKDKFN